MAACSRDAMPAPTIVENGIERFVLCDLSAPSGWVLEQPKRRRVKVWWLVGDGGEYFEGTVIDQRKARRESEDVFIEYDDGEKHWHNTDDVRMVELAREDAPEVRVSLASHPETLSASPPNKRID